jgi:hypothetical protein
MHALAQTIDFFPYLVQPAEWIVSALMLIVVACERFNTPPTNRSSTTFALFSFGLILYYALIVALWLVVTIAVRQGAVGFDKSVILLGGPNPKVRAEFAPYAGTKLPRASRSRKAAARTPAIPNRGEFIFRTADRS